jgi:hypothetical protein
MKKCFDAIAKLELFEEGSTVVKGLISPEGERLEIK